MVDGLEGHSVGVLSFSLSPPSSGFNGSAKGPRLTGALDRRQSITAIYLIFRGSYARLRTRPSPECRGFIPTGHHANVSGDRGAQYDSPQRDFFQKPEAI
jgi:hypothetical protein